MLLRGIVEEMSEYADELRAEKQRLRMELDAHKRDHRCSIHVCKTASILQMLIHRVNAKISDIYKEA
jgi:glutamate-1-semialdehyde aminotransferase